MSVEKIPLLEAGDTRLMKISRDGVLSLSLEEMQKIRDYFIPKKRNPTVMELETLAQTWSEHCRHKTLAGRFRFEKIKNGKSEIRNYGNALKETIFLSTRELKKKWCLSVFKDNAGVISFNKDNAIAFKVETHNHPSALEPKGGAETGIGGVIRDILGVGQGAKPVMNTDVFCFGLPKTPDKSIPEGALNPLRVMRGVVSGVRDYGNRMGIPTASGAVLFDRGFTFNPLVFCGTLGIMPKNKVGKKVRPKDLIVTAGGRTGRDGIHGATFSSISLDAGSEISAVQIGNAITEKKLMNAVLKARDLNLYNGITDCGAGGFSSAIGELAVFSGGAEVDLSFAPLKYEGLKPWEIWVSEAQERMVFSVPARNLKKIMKVFAEEEVEAAVLGKFSDSGLLRVCYKNTVYMDLEMKFLHGGIPQTEKKAVYVFPEKKPFPPAGMEYGKLLEEKLSGLNTCSRENIIRQYDFEVQGNTVIKPFCGAENDGPSDCSVIKPLPRSWKGVAVSNGINLYGKYDTYSMTVSAIDEALRNITAVGGSLEQTALLDNFCWGRLETKEDYGGLLVSLEACREAALIYGTPFISGKDSLNNMFRLKGGKSISIPPVLMISAVSVIPDIRKCITMNLKKNGNPLYICGYTENELYPMINARESANNMRLISKAIFTGYAASCHDCSEGGLAVALAEMCFSGGLGAEVCLGNIPVRKQKSGKKLTATEGMLLFSESNGRLILEIKREREKEFCALAKNGIFKKIGQVKDDGTFSVIGPGGRRIIEKDIKRLKEIWKKPLSFL